MERAFSSSHSQASEAFGKVMDAYMDRVEGGKDIAKRIEDIKGRARYT